MPTVPLPMPRLGMDLLSEDSRLPAGCVRRAVNVDIDRDGQVAARGGFVTRFAGGRFVAIGCFAGRCWVQRGRDVMWLDTSAFAMQPLLDAASAQPVASAEVNGDLWMASSGGLWRVDGRSWRASRAPVLPRVLPRVAASHAGALDEGVYGVAVSVSDAHGVESAAAWLGECRTNAGLLLHDLPVLPGLRWHVYLTAANGDVLYEAESFDAVAAQMLLGRLPSGQACETRGLAPLPGGHAICAKGGRLYVARGDILMFSRAFRPWLYHPAHDWVSFAGRVRFLAAMQDGLFVGDDRGVWWLGGDDPQNARMQLASPARALAGSAVVLPARESARLAQGLTVPCAVWLGETGYQLGMPDGTVRDLQPGRLSLDATQAGRSVHVRRSGMSQVVTLTNVYEPRALPGAAVDLF